MVIVDFKWKFLQIAFSKYLKVEDGKWLQIQYSLQITMFWKLGIILQGRYAMSIPSNRNEHLFALAMRKHYATFLATSLEATRMCTGRSNKTDRQDRWFRFLMSSCI